MSAATEVDRSDDGRQALAEGEAAWREGCVDLAATLFAKAACLAPHRPEGHANLGVVLRRLGHLDASIASQRRALALAPDNAGNHTNLGNALREAGRLEEAVHHLRRAVDLAPGTPSFTYNLALGLRDFRRMTEAAALMESLVATHPANADYAWDLALIRLYQRDYAQGFAGYEARWGLARNRTTLPSGERLVAGMDVAGKTVLLISEQGFGDALQFARFVPLLARRGARVVLECLPQLAELFANLPGVAQVVEKHASPPPYDLWAPMLSLPHILGITWGTLPADTPYLAPPKGGALPIPRIPGTTLNVGLCWAGKTVPRDRSWPIERLMPLLADPRAAFWSLQLGPRAADLATSGAGLLIRQFGRELKSFADTAAVLAELDLVITIDTSMAHLAGAMGKPVWVLLRYVSDWRWLDDGDTCAWYPGMRLFRQADPFDFDGPVARMAAELSQAISRRE